jgi:hypothetical protein
MVYKMCDIITFTYSSPTAKDRNPICMVVAPMYQGLTHAVNLKYLPEREREMLIRISHPDYTSTIGSYVDKIPALQKVLKKRQQDPDSMSSRDFYYVYVAGFARRFNCYRKYRPQYMMGINVLDLDKLKL